jgi:hypothetical protein
MSTATTTRRPTGCGGPTRGSPPACRRSTLAFREQATAAFSKGVDLDTDDAQMMAAAAADRPEAAPAAERLGWMDEVGIETQLVLFSDFDTYKAAIRAGERALGVEVLAASNTWIADYSDGHTDRLVPITLVDFADVDVDGARAHAHARSRKPRVPLQVRTRHLLDDERAGGMVAFASDFCHFEGTGKDGPAWYDAVLDDYNDEVTEHFFRGATQELFDRAAGLSHV